MNLLTNVVRVLIIGFIQLHPCYGESDPQVCLPDQFQCSVRHCIPNRWRCDGESDCDGGVDEIDCGNTTERCSKNHFRCLSDSRCVPGNWKCDGERDCNDGSDEESCESSAKKCSDNHFHCATENSCMPLHWRCDGERDCNDGSDEENCVVPVTTEEQCPDFYCKQNVECIVINHEYSCLCTLPYTGQRCETKISSEHDAYDYTWVIVTVLTVVFICVATSLFFVYRRRRSRSLTPKMIILKNEDDLILNV